MKEFAFQLPFVKGSEARQNRGNLSFQAERVSGGANVLGKYNTAYKQRESASITPVRERKALNYNLNMKRGSNPGNKRGSPQKDSTLTFEVDKNSIFYKEGVFENFNADNEMSPSEMYNPRETLRDLAPPGTAGHGGSMGRKVQELNKVIMHHKNKVIDLEDKIVNLTEINRKLMESKLDTVERDEMHRMYQTLFIDDYKKQIEDLTEKLSKLRFIAKNQSSAMKKLTAENEDLKSTVAMYRKMMQTQRRTNQNSNSVDGLSDNGSTSRTHNDLNSSFNASMLGTSGVQKKASQYSVETAVLEKVSGAFKQCFGMSDPISLLANFIKHTTQILNCGYARVIIVDEHLRNLTKKKTKAVDTMYIGKDEVLSFIDKNLVLDTPEQYLNDLPNLKTVRKSVIKNDVLVCPVFELKTDWNLLCLIQCCDSKNMKSGKKRGFRFKDEVVLSMVAQLYASCFTFIKQHEEIRRQKKKFEHFLEMIMKIASEANMQILALNFKETLPKFFNFNAGGVLFYNSKENYLYSLEPTVFADGTVVTGSILRYPTNVGISGMAFEKNIPHIENNPTKNVNYNPEVDNMAGVPVIHNLMVYPVTTSFGEIVALIQLANKKGDKPIDDEDRATFEATSKVFGNIIKHVLLVIECKNLSFALKDTVNNIESGLRQRDKEK